MDRSSELAQRLHDLHLDYPGVTVSAAESCSGGGIASAITSVSGSSEYFLGSVVAYVNEAKHQLLGVPRDVLDTRGAVSPECAVAMAEGSRKAFDSSIAVATTGIAGPTGATDRKPIGLVYIACATDWGTDVEEHRYSGNRADVTRQTVQRGLELIIEAIKR